jgi:hypothetical protein
MKYAFARDACGEHWKWTLRPWQQRGLREFDRLKDVPDDYVLVVSHFAPWWSPLREYIAEGRPWIEIEYGYWGPDTPRRETRRVTWCGHHNMSMRPTPHSRAHLFPNPAQQSWQQRTGSYVLAIQPVEEILTQRTGENMPQFRDRLTAEIRRSWAGDIVWRKKMGGAKPTRWPSYVEQLQAAHAVVGERTMACVEACLLGVPAYTTDASMTTLLMGDISNLADRKFPDRSAWWEHICWSQYNRAEFETAVPADLTELYQIQSCI